MRKLLLALLLALAPAMAAPGDFFDSLRSHPAARSAELSLEASRQQMINAANYVSVDASGGYVYRGLTPADPCPLLSDPDPSNDIFCQVLVPDVPESTGQSEIGLTLHAFPYGDLADYQANARINYEIARVDYRSNLANLEKGALEAAMQYYLAHQARNLAEKGLEVSRAAYEATKTRHKKGAASQRDLRQAELALAEAEVELKNAEASLRLAEASLRSFTDASPPAWPWPELAPPPNAEPPGVTKARLRLEQARLGLERSKRSFIPVGEVRLQHNFDDYNAIGVSIESRTLGARVYYGYQSYADPTRSRTENELRLGLRLNVSQSSWGDLEAARDRKAAAELALEAARKQSDLELARLQLRLEQTKGQISLAQKRLEAAKSDYRESQQRVRVGVASPLEEQRYWLQYSKSQLELLKVEQDYARAQLDMLNYLAIPPSEVWK